jgi:hypothetical protein
VLLNVWEKTAIGDVTQAEFVQTCPTAQTCPQAPQLLTLVTRLVSQPFAERPSQLPKPALHDATVQTPLVQAAAPFAPPHDTPHAPQLLMLVRRLVSQPFAEMPSQLPKPAMQDSTWHVPAEQAEPPLARLQATPHVPQWVGSFCRLVHAPLQLVSPGPHVVAHDPALQVLPAGQVLEQEPQLPLSLWRFLQTPPQLVSPAWQDSTHDPALQT